MYISAQSGPGTRLPSPKTLPAAVNRYAFASDEARPLRRKKGDQLCHFQWVGATAAILGEGVCVVDAALNERSVRSVVEPAALLQLCENLCVRACVRACVCVNE
jgi:hypothetical protein